VTKRYNSYTWLSIDDAKKEVKNFLDINNIYYDEICYTEEHQDKKEYCEQLSLDILLDDNPYEIQALKDSSIKSICFNAGYNHNNTDGVFARVYSFYEFLELIESL
jgi:uncharacterized HAD superfamily protein